MLIFEIKLYLGNDSAFFCHSVIIVNQLLINGKQWWKLSETHECGARKKMTFISAIEFSMRFRVMVLPAYLEIVSS